MLLAATQKFTSFNRKKAIGGMESPPRLLHTAQSYSSQQKKSTQEKVTLCRGK
jgi:hypothetical protein